MKALLAGLALCLALTGCTGDERPADDPATDPTPPAATADTAAADTAAPADEVLRSDETAPDEDEEPAPTDAAERPAATARGTLDSTFEGTAGIIDVPKTGAGPGIMQAVRAGRHEHFDRIVFEFAGDQVPGYHVEYVDRPVRECGSGHTVELAGDGWLEVRFMPSRAHTEAGEVTIQRRERTYGYPVLRELALTCDFEGVVTWVAGVAAPNRYRVQEFADPPRLVLDIRH